MAETDAAEQISFQTGLPPYVRELALQIQIPPTKELDTLPFTNLEPRNFERLCLRLIERETDVHGHATLYGRSGQKQHGIDVFAQRRDTKEYWVYQSKRYEHYDPSKLNEAVRMFVRNWQVAKGEEPSFVGIKPLPVKKQKPGTTTTPEDTESKAYTPPAWFKEIKKFVVCVTVDFGADKDLGDAKTELSQMLNDLGLELEVWHAEVINQKLKNLPEIVEEFFGVDGVKRFCPESVSTVYLQGMNARALLTIKRPSWNAKVKTLSPAELLVSRNRIVPFAGREPELEYLRAWCNTDSSFDVLAYTGAGGTGKTRLLLEYCLEMQSKGWIAGFVDNIRRSKNPEAWDQLLKDDLLKQNRPVLIVMDYAENRSEELTPLLQAVQENLNERELPVRLVLIARGIGEWYEQLRNNDGAKSLLPGNKPESNPKLEEIKLSSPTTLETLEAVEQEFFRAAERFAATRDKTVPEEIPVDLSADLFQRVLFVHMAALLAVETGERIRDVSQAGILERVLELETNYWAKRLNNKAFIPGLLRTMTLVTLGYPVQNLEEAVQLLTLDEDFGELTTLEKKALANMLHDTYPGFGFINPIEPDLIAEHLIYTQLTDKNTGAKLRDTAFGTAGSEPDTLHVNPRRALEHLVRLADWREDVTARNGLWGLVLEGRLNNGRSELNNSWSNLFILFAMQIARETATHGTKLGDLLAELLEVSENHVLASYAKKYLPDYSVSLLKFTEVVRRIAQNTDDEVQQLVDLANHANSLSNLGSREQALAETMIVVQGYKKLAALDPEKFLPNYAALLNNQSNCQGAVGDRPGALATITEAVKIRRELVLKNRDTFLPNLAGGLTNQSNCQSDVGDRPEALATSTEAVKIYRELVLKNRDAFLPDLAMSLNNQSNCQSAVGDRPGALVTITEAVKIRRELVLKNRDTFLPNLAGGLTNQSTCQSAVGDRPEALATITEAVKIYRELVLKNRDTFLPDLAISLNNQSTYQSDVGDRPEALATITEALKIRTDLSTLNPRAFTPDLVTSYGAQGQILMALEKFIEARESFAQGLRLLIPFVTESPQTFEQLAQILAGEYLSSSKSANLEPDIALLEPLLAVLMPDNEFGNEIQELLEEFEPFLQDVAIVALGNNEPQKQIEEHLAILEGNGFQIKNPIHQIWAGERDLSVLTTGLNAQESAIIIGILEIIAPPDHS